jgi:hypothetical protein
MIPSPEVGDDGAVWPRIASLILAEVGVEDLDDELRLGAPRRRS